MNSIWALLWSVVKLARFSHIPECNLRARKNTIAQWSSQQPWSLLRHADPSPSVSKRNKAKKKPVYILYG